MSRNLKKLSLKVLVFLKVPQLRKKLIRTCNVVQVVPSVEVTVPEVRHCVWYVEQIKDGRKLHGKTVIFECMCMCSDAPF